jgi:hypothetical protein
VTGFLSLPKTIPPTITRHSRVVEIRRYFIFHPPFM